MRRIGRIVSFALLACLTSNTAAFAAVVQKPGFSLSLPKGWVEIPQSVLASVHKELSRRAPNAKLPKYDYGFQPAKAKRWMAYPYVLVQISHDGKIPEDELKAMPKLQLNELGRAQAASFKSIISNSAIGQAQYDEAARIVWVTSRSDIVGVGKVQGLTGVIPTETGSITFHGYSLQRNFAALAPTFREIVQSTSLPRPKTPTPRWTDKIPGLKQFDWRGMNGSLLIGAIVGAGCGVVAGLFVGVRSLMRGDA
jgi:hypothetical protein